MRPKKFLLPALVLLTAVLLAGCGAAPTTAWHGLTTDGTTAYLAAGARIFAVDAATGDELWRYSADTDVRKGLTFYADPVLTGDGQLIVGSSASKDNVLISLDAASGDFNWRFPQDGPADAWVGPVLVTETAIFAPNADHSLYMLSLDGELQATFAADGALWGRPATDGQLVYIASLEHTLYALDPQAGLTERWSLDLGGAVPGGPLVVDNILYISTFNDAVVAVDTASGRIIDTYETDAWVWGTPLVTDGTLYFGDLDGHLHAFNLTDGRPAWPAFNAFIAEAKGNSITASPLLWGDLLILGSENGTLYALDRDGVDVWDRPVGGPLYGTPVVAGEYVLVAPNLGDALLVAVDARGREAWGFTPEK